MLKISNVRVYNFERAVIASGNAMRTEPAIKEGFSYQEDEVSKSLERCKKLTKAGFSDVSCHSNYLTGILVSFDVVYPQYWTPESQRYHWFNIVTSSSKMHRLCKMNVKNCFNEYTDPRSIEILQEKIDVYNAIKDNTWEVGSLKYTAFMQMLSSCPLGLELFEHVTTNYKQLQTIYYQRRHHKLLEDWGPFCEMIENLPYAKELILKEE